MRLFLIRHGETPLNVTRVIQPAATPLSERGLAQAAALASRLASSNAIAGIVSSDLPRAMQTAQQLALASGLAITSSALLHERNFGDLRGRSYDQLQVDPQRMAEAPPGGESMSQFLQRVEQAFAHVLRLQAELGGPLAVISHGLVVKAMLQHHAQLTGDQKLPPSLRNTSLSIVSAQAPYPIELLNCTTHLGDELLELPGSLSGG